MPAATSSTRVPWEMGSAPASRGPSGQQERLDHLRVVARGPHGAVARLELRVCDVDRHLRSPFRSGCAKRRIRSGAIRAHRDISLSAAHLRTRGGSRRSVRLPRMRPPRRGSRVDAMLRLILLAFLCVLVLPAAALAAPAKISPRASAVSDAGVATVEVANPNRYVLRGTAKVTAARPHRREAQGPAAQALRQHRQAPLRWPGRRRAARGRGPRHDQAAAPSSRRPHVVRAADAHAAPPLRRAAAARGARRSARAARLRPLGRPDGHRGRLRRPRAHRQRRAAPDHEGLVRPGLLLRDGRRLPQRDLARAVRRSRPVDDRHRRPRRQAGHRRQPARQQRRPDDQLQGDRVDAAGRQASRARWGSRSPTPSTTSSPTRSRSSTAPAPSPSRRCRPSRGSSRRSPCG